MEEPPNLNTGEPWSDLAIADLRWQVKRKIPVDQIAEFLCRTEKEVRDQAKKLGLGELPTVKGERKRKLIPGTRKPRPIR